MRSSLNLARRGPSLAKWTCVSCSVGSLHSCGTLRKTHRNIRNFSFAYNTYVYSGVITLTTPSLDLCSPGDEQPPLHLLDRAVLPHHLGERHVPNIAHSKISSRPSFLEDVSHLLL